MEYGVGRWSRVETAVDARRRRRRILSVFFFYSSLGRRRRRRIDLIELKRETPVLFHRVAGVGVETTMGSGGHFAYTSPASPPAITPLSFAYCIFYVFRFLFIISYNILFPQSILFSFFFLFSFPKSA